MTAGAIQDSRTPDTYTVQARDVQSGKTIDLALRDGRTLSGTFEDLVTFDDTVYAGRYAQALELSAGKLPRLGETLTVLDKRGRQIDACVTGFDHSGICLETADGRHRQVSLMAIEELRSSDGTIIRADTLLAMVSRGAIPFRSAIKLRGDNDPTLVPLDSVSVVSVHNTKGRWWKGALIGLATDVAVVVVFALSWEPMGAW
jgi:hypothetical protein